MNEARSRFYGLSLASTAIACLLILLVSFNSVERKLERVERSAPDAASSPDRTLSLLRRLAQEPHVVGTVENAKVRETLIHEIGLLGQMPSVHSGWGMTSSRTRTAAGFVNNVLVRVPGRVPGKALLLVAHYDSVGSGPGAADNAASVVNLLNTLETVSGEPRLRNDLIFLFTDGEEAGLLGGQLFATSHPWMADIGLILNFDYRGNSGPIYLFETTENNGKLINGYGAAVTDAKGSSLLTELYKRMPNDTDLSVLRNSGVPGLNFAAGEGQFAYHTQLDRPELVDPSTLEDQRVLALEMVRHFGNISLEGLESADAVFFDFAGLGLVHYPEAFALPLALIAASLFFVVIWTATKGGFSTKRGTLIGTFAFPFVSILAATAAQCLWQAIQWINPEYSALDGAPYNGHWYFLAFVVLTFAIFLVASQWLRRWISPTDFAFGSGIWWTILLVASSSLTAGVSFVFLWPMLFWLVSCLIAYSSRARIALSVPTIWFIALGLIPGALLFASTARIIFLALGPDAAYLPALVVSLWLGLAAPLVFVLAQRRTHHLVPWLACGCLVALGLSTAKFDSLHPRPNSVFYVQNAGNNVAFWLSSDESLDSWTTQFLSKGSRRRVPEVYDDSRQLFWAAEAPDVGLPSPSLQVLEDRAQGDVRTLVVELRSGRRATRLGLGVTGTAVIAAALQDVPISGMPRKHWAIDVFGAPKATVKLRLRVEANKPFRIRVSDVSRSLPRSQNHPRPSNMMVTPFGQSDSTELFVDRNFGPSPEGADAEQSRL